MANEPDRQTALGDVAARQLANATKTVPQMSRITPRWLTHLLQWVPVEAGIYRLNRVKDEANVTVEGSSGIVLKPSRPPVASRVAPSRGAMKRLIG